MKMTHGAAALSIAAAALLACLPLPTWAQVPAQHRQLFLSDAPTTAPAPPPGMQHVPYSDCGRACWVPAVAAPRPAEISGREVAQPNFWAIFSVFALLTLWIGWLVRRELSPKRRQSFRAERDAIRTKKAEIKAGRVWMETNYPRVARYCTRGRWIGRLGAAFCYAALSWLYLFPFSYPLPLALALGGLGILLRLWYAVRFVRFENWWLAGSAQRSHGVPAPVLRGALATGN
jgi:hypothetical protein